MKEISNSPPANDAVSQRIIYDFSTMDSDDEDGDSPSIKLPARQVSRKSAMKKRKTYIESDEENGAADRYARIATYEGAY